MMSFTIRPSGSTLSRVKSREVDSVSRPADSLASLWDGLSPHLLASFYEVQRVGHSRNWEQVNGGPVVKAPLMGDVTLEIVAPWQSPFENSGKESAPTLKAMLASGALTTWFDKKDAGAASKFASQAEGRTGVTRLNSTQVFEGMPPLKITLTALFRAWKDAIDEVETPFNQLVKWALPHALADDGILMNALKSIKEAARGQPLDQAATHTFLPSIAPCKIGMRYKGRIYHPMVIESITLPLGAPVDRDGRFVEMAVPMMLCSLSAIDQKDWDESRYRGFKS